MTLLNYVEDLTMGSAPWDIFTEYQPDTTAALKELRQKYFEAEYPDAASIEEVIEDADADGTCSILDIEEIGLESIDVPRGGDCGSANPLSTKKLIELYGTDKPTRQQIEGNDDFFDDIARGCAIYIIAYKSEKPSEIYFAGMSYD
jgi:hypothetical protein